MEYIYDIVLNFQDKYYDFYEWLPTDKIINVKRIPIYKITTKDYLEIKNNDTIIDRSTIPKQNKMFLLTSGFEIIGILLDNEGKVIKKSSLIFEESDDILDDLDDIIKINLKYTITKVNKPNYQSRSNLDKIKYINNYLNNLDKEKDKYLLKYLYFDLYNIDEDNIELIYNKLIDLSKTNTSKLYSSIKRVNLELKK